MSTKRITSKASNNEAFYGSVTAALTTHTFFVESRSLGLIEHVFIYVCMSFSLFKNQKLRSSSIWNTTSLPSGPEHHVALPQSIQQSYLKAAKLGKKEATVSCSLEGRVRRLQVRPLPFHSPHIFLQKFQVA